MAYSFRLPVYQDERKSTVIYLVSFSFRYEVKNSVFVCLFVVCNLHRN